VNRFRLPGRLLVSTGATLAVSFASATPGPILTELMTKQLPDLRGKEMHAITVEYPPGGSDPTHRHDAHVFVYVLEGAVVMGLKGQKEVNLTKGQTFFEAPGDVHTVSRNASSTEPARFLVVFVKGRGVDAVLPTP